MEVEHSAQVARMVDTGFHEKGGKMGAEPPMQEDSLSTPVDIHCKTEPRKMAVAEVDTDPDIQMTQGFHSQSEVSPVDTRCNLVDRNMRRCGEEVGVVDNLPPSLEHLVLDCCHSTDDDNRRLYHHLGKLA